MRETPSGEMERSCRRAVDPEAGNVAMQRVKHPPVRNKIDLADPSQVRAWTKRLGIPVEVLKAVVDKIGNSVAAVTKEVELHKEAELQRANRPAPPLCPADSPPAKGELPAAV
jgi:hypothetical protein